MDSVELVGKFCSLHRDELLEIINHFGLPHQVRKLNEEVFEASEAIISDDTISHIIEELTDVMVVLLQLINYYDADPAFVDRVISFKIKRVLDSIQKS